MNIVILGCCFTPTVVLHTDVLAVVGNRDCDTGGAGVCCVVKQLSNHSREISDQLTYIQEKSIRKFSSKLIDPLVSPAHSLLASEFDNAFISEA